MHAKMFSKVVASAPFTRPYALDPAILARFAPCLQPDLGLLQDRALEIHISLNPTESCTLGCTIDFDNGSWSHHRMAQTACVPDGALPCHDPAMRTIISMAPMFRPVLGLRFARTNCAAITRLNTHQLPLHLAKPVRSASYAPILQSCSAGRRRRRYKGVDPALPQPRTKSV
jgi:hypothetical protein